MPASPLAESLMRGVAANPAAPSAVLLRLLSSESQPAWKTLCRERDLPDEIVEAILAHPERGVRGGFALNRHVDPAHRGQLMEDRDPFVRRALASGPPAHLGRPRPLPHEVIECLLTARDPDGQAVAISAAEIREELAGSGQIPQSFRRAAPTHQHPTIRAFAVGMWLFLAPPRLLLDAFIAGRRQRPSLLAHRRLPRTGLAGLLNHEDPEVRALAAADSTLPHPPLAHLDDPDPRVRAAAAANRLLPPDLLARLLTEPDHAQAAASNASLSAEQQHDLLTRAGIP
jgi:hypothetical protein